MTKEDWEIYDDRDILIIGNRSPADFIDDIKMEYIRPYLPESGTILEIGAGSGRLSTRIGLEHPDTYKLIGVDYSPSAVDVIQKNYDKFNLNGKAINGDIMMLDEIDDNSVDFVCSGGVLEHFTLTEVLKLFSELQRVMKPESIFYADVVPQKRSLCRPIIKKDVGGFESNYQLFVWNSLLVVSGFKILQSFNGCIIPPDFYRAWNNKRCMDIMYKHKDFIKSLDGTWIADKIGFCYYIIAEA